MANGLVLLAIKNQIMPVWFDYYDHYNLKCSTHHLHLISICLRPFLKRDWIHYLLFHLTAHCLPYMAKTCTQNKYWIKWFQCDLIIMIITTWYASLNLQYLISNCLKCSLPKDKIHYLLFYLAAFQVPCVAKTCTQNKYWIKFFQCDLIIMIITTWNASLNLQYLISNCLKCSLPRD